VRVKDLVLSLAEEQELWAEAGRLLLKLSSWIHQNPRGQRVRLSRPKKMEKKQDRRQKVAEIDC